MFEKIRTPFRVIPPENKLRGFSIQSGNVDEVFISIMPMLADATDVSAAGTNALGCLLDKRTDAFHAFSYFAGKICDFFQLISATRECLLQKMNYLTIRE